jgi:hypothetical protein
MDNMDYNQRYILELERSFRKQLDEKGISANPYANKRFYLFLAAAWMVNSKMESDSEMFHAVGTNAFGYKNAISTPAVFDDTLREDWSFDDSREREDTYYDFFEHFGGSSTKPQKSDKDEEAEDYKTQLYQSERYTGTIPELEHYFVALTKDKFRFWWDQRPERFYLVAPCKADVDVKVTKIECYGEPLSYEKSKSKWNSFFGNEAKYETGTKNELLSGSDEYPDGIVPDFYDKSASGEETMLYSLDENGELIKDCQTNMGAYFKEKINPFDSPYTPTTIEINPILDKRQDPNYCYAGYDFEETKMYLAFNVALPMTTSLVGGAACSAATLGTAAPICFALGGYVGSIAGGLAYEAIEAGYLGGRVHWPYHTQEISIGKQTQYAVQDAIGETDAEETTNEKETAENP